MEEVRKQVSDTVAAEYWTTVLSRVAASGREIRTAAGGAADLERGLATAQEGGLTIATGLGVLDDGALALERGLNVLANGALSSFRRRVAGWRAGPTISRPAQLRSSAAQMRLLRARQGTRRSAAGLRICRPDSMRSKPGRQASGRDEEAARRGGRPRRLAAGRIGRRWHRGEPGSHGRPAGCCRRRRRSGR